MTGCPAYLDSTGARVYVACAEEGMWRQITPHEDLAAGLLVKTCCGCRARIEPQTWQPSWRTGWGHRLSQEYAAETFWEQS